MKINNVMNETERLLRDRAELRECDQKLVAMYYWEHLSKGGANLEQMTARQLLSAVYNKRLPSSEAITRARRKLQELHPELRGSNYAKRLQEVKAVKKELGYGTSN